MQAAEKCKRSSVFLFDKEINNPCVLPFTSAMLASNSGRKPATSIEAEVELIWSLIIDFFFLFSFVQCVRTWK